VFEYLAGKIIKKALLIAQSLKADILFRNERKSQQ
jgi:hypothetical protein